MATFTVTIPDAAVPDVVAALCSKYGWNSTLGVTQQQFAKNQLGQWLAGAYVEYKSAQAAAAAAVTAQATANTYAAQVTVA